MILAHSHWWTAVGIIGSDRAISPDCWVSLRRRHFGEGVVAVRSLVYKASGWDCSSSSLSAGSGESRVVRVLSFCEPVYPLRQLEVFIRTFVLGVMYIG